MTTIQTVYPKRIYFAEKIFTKEECDKYIQFIDDMERTSTEPQPYTYRFQLQPVVPDLAREFWKKLSFISKTIEKDAGIKLKDCSDRIPFVRYDADAIGCPGHRDHKWINEEKYGAIVYLNEDFLDGRTKFYNPFYQEAINIKPKTGDVVFFHMDTFHEASAPEGVKYIICPRFV
jgi:hypothetical protein